MLCSCNPKQQPKQANVPCSFATNVPPTCARLYVDQSIGDDLSRSRVTGNMSRLVLSKAVNRELLLSPQAVTICLLVSDLSPVAQRGSARVPIPVQDLRLKELLRVRRLPVTYNTYTQRQHVRRGDCA